MSGRPFRSCLIPYEEEIFNLRSRKPPMPYAQIADELREKHQLSVCRETIFKFVRARSRGRRAYFMMRDVAAKKSAAVIRAAKPQTKAGQQPAVTTGEGQPPKPRFEFKYSERYNLTRLPPEVAAARRKKLEEEGH